MQHVQARYGRGALMIHCDDYFFTQEAGDEHHSFCIHYVPHMPMLAHKNGSVSATSDLALFFAIVFVVCVLYKIVRVEL
jgi:hypothetical protein